MVSVLRRAVPAGSSQSHCWRPRAFGCCLRASTWAASSARRWVLQVCACAHTQICQSAVVVSCLFSYTTECKVLYQQIHRQDMEEGCEAGEKVGGQAASSEELVWFTEIADEHDALRRQILALQTQKVRTCGLKCAGHQDACRRCAWQG
jgi:hypothetical protein